MNLSSLSVRRPITFAMFFLAVLIFGTISLLRLPINLLPDITYPSITIFTGYEGAGPRETEKLITELIEKAISTISNVKDVRSVSDEDTSVVTVDFNWGTDLAEAADEIRERLDRIRRFLPEDAGDPSLYKYDPSNRPILYLSLTGSLHPSKLRDLAEDWIKYDIEQLEGVAAVDIWGGLERQILVEVDGAKLRALGLSIDSIVEALRGENLSMAGGRLESGRREWLVRPLGEFRSPEDIENVVVASMNGTPVYLRQLAQVRDGFKELRRHMRIKGRPGVFLAIRKQSGSNTVQVSDRVLGILPRLEQGLPAGISLSVVLDTAEFIRKSIRQVQQVAWIGGILAVAVLFIFLRNIRSTMIIATSIPVAIWATFFLLDHLGLTINMMSLGGLALGIGMILDSSIVVLENIFRHREGGEEAGEGAVEGSREVAMAITASTLTTICVFLPLLFLSGVEGLMFKQMALTVTFSLMASLAVALSLIPMLASRFLKTGRRGPGVFLVRLQGTYSRGLSWSLGHRGVVLGGSVLLLLAAFVGLYLRGVGTELLPVIDEGIINGSIEMPVGTRLDVTDGVTRQVEEIFLHKVPEVREMFARSGAHWRGGGGSNFAFFRVYLSDRKDRDRSTSEIVSRLRPILSGIAGANVRIYEGQSMYTGILGGGREERLEIDLRGHDLAQGKELAMEIARRIGGVGGVVYPRISLEDSRPELQIVIDRAKAADMDLSMSRILRSIHTYLEGTVASKYRQGGEEVDILVRLREADRGSVADLGNLWLNPRRGGQLPLKSLARVVEGKGPTKIERRGQQRLITVRAGIQGRDLGSVVGDVKERIRGLELPESFRLDFASEYEKQREAFGGLWFAIALAVVLVYMVMASQFESLTEPFVIMFALPFAAIGAILAILLVGMNVNIPVLIGGVLLIGIVVNNGIVLIDCINRLRLTGHPLREAIVSGAGMRLRPILMTTLTTCLALLPMALGFGEGAEMNAPMARVVIGGLLVSGLFTLFFVPTLYGTLKRMDTAAQVAPVSASDAPP